MYSILLLLLTVGVRQADDDGQWSTSTSNTISLLSMTTAITTTTTTACTDCCYKYRQQDIDKQMTAFVSTLDGYVA